MLKVNKNGIEYYTFEHLTNAGVDHGFPNRKNGYSKDCYSSLNFTYSTGDNEDDVNKNYKKLFETFNIDLYAKGQQVHNNKVVNATKENNVDIYKETDGFVTKEDITLLTFHADCGSVFMYDIKKDVYGLVHSGWRGTTLNIAGVALNKLIEDFGSNPKDILIGIGPSISYNCFEVDLDVAKVFIDIGYSKFTKYSEETNKYYIDIKNILKEQCLQKGVPLENIEVSNICTKCNEKEFYSHRRNGSNRGVHTSFIKKRRG